MKISPQPTIALMIADNGVLLDWGDGRKEIFPATPKDLGIVLSKLSGLFEGFYSGDFIKETIDVRIKIKENWADNEGI